jgi:hypothetical protein
MPSTHNAAFAKRLETLLVQNKRTVRSGQRGLLAASIRPRPPLLWGGARVRYLFWWGASLIASIALPGLVALWFNAHGRPLPGGAFNLLLFIVVLFAWPVIAFVKRAREIKGRTPMEATAFEEGVRKMAPSVPAGFALAVRNALAAAYCVPVELIGYADTRQRSKALSLMSEPLAAEIIAQVCQSQGAKLDYERMRSAAEFFRTHRPSTVTELVILMHKEMLSAQLQ